MGYDKEVEPKILKFWEDNQIYEKAKKKNQGKKDYYFLDGPPYTSGKVHLGTAWNKSIKDCLLRYKRMAGFNVWDRAGYDMHGLPTEKATEKKLNLKGKEDIVKFGIDKFITECKNLCLTNMEAMNETFKRLGVWMDFDNAYQSITEDFIEGEWWLLEQAHNKDRLYEGERTMTWCADCATACAKHELEYEEVNEESIFVKFQVDSIDNEYLIIWTTTPWTIPFNLAVMVNPELDYVKAKITEGDHKGEVWIVAKALVGIFINSVANEKFEIIEEFKGEKLEGLHYQHPFDDELKYKEQIDAEKLHTVLLSKEYVDTSAGTGLVHTAPGCGPEDYEVGYQNGLPPFNVLDEKGIFPAGFGSFGNLKAKTDDKTFIKKLEEKGALIASTKVEHDYPHCWRCHNPVIFRTTKQWFFKIEDIKENMIKENDKIKWVPEAAYNAFNSWLKNLRDNSITKQRFWGTPLPIWRCECGEYELLSTKKAIEERSGMELKDLHLPWIDEIKFSCKKCNKEMARVPDILDVWVDAGTTSWNCLDYPKTKENFEKLFPAEFILEGKDQIRGWFNLLMVASMIALEKPSFKNVYMHGFVNDSQGRKMSKSLGNYILPEEVIDEYGSDTFRYYIIGGANPGIDLNYNMEDVKLKYRNLTVLWNLHNLLLDLNTQVVLDDNVELGLEEKYILSRLNSTILKTTQLYESYKLNEVPLEIEKLFLDLSRNYIQYIRDKTIFGTEDEKKAIVHTIFQVLMGTLKMFATICPMITDKIYLNLKKPFNMLEDSIHLLDWPKEDSKMINKELEEEIDIANDVIRGILSAREKAKLNVRWPLISVTIETEHKKAIEKMESLIKNQTNVKEIVLVDKFDHVRTNLEPDTGKLGPDFKQDAKKVAQLIDNNKEKVLAEIHNKCEIEGYTIVKEHVIIQREVDEPYIESSFRKGHIYIDTTRNEELEAEGYSREIMRRVQQLRKNAGMKKEDEIELFIKFDIDLEPYANTIKERCGAKRLTVYSEQNTKLNGPHTEKIKGKEVIIKFDKV